MVIHFFNKVIGSDGANFEKYRMVINYLIHSFNFFYSSTYLKDIFESKGCFCDYNYKLNELREDFLSSYRSMKINLSDPACINTYFASFSVKSFFNATVEYLNKLIELKPDFITEFLDYFMTLSRQDIVESFLKYEISEVLEEKLYNLSLDEENNGNKRTALLQSLTKNDNEKLIKLLDSFVTTHVKSCENLFNTIDNYSLALLEHMEDSLQFSNYAFLGAINAPVIDKLSISNIGMYFIESLRVHFNLLQETIPNAFDTTAIQDSLISLLDDKD